MIFDLSNKKTLDWITVNLFLYFEFDHLKLKKRINEKI